MQKLNILGTALTDYSLKESLALVDDYMRNGALNTVLYITTPALIMAGKDENEKHLLESMDLTLCGDADILKVARIQTVSRKYEVENYVFLKEFLRRIVRNGKKIYLLAESEEEVRRLKSELEAFQSGIIVGGSGRITGETEDIGEIINKINDVAPTAIISRMSLGVQEKWMLESRLLINAEVWLGIAGDMVLDGTKESFRKKVMDRISRRIFYRKMNRFKDEKRESD